MRGWIKNIFRQDEPQHTEVIKKPERAWIERNGKVVTGILVGRATANTGIMLSLQVTGYVFRTDGGEEFIVKPEKVYREL